MVNALIRARQLKMDCVAVFTANQRQWKTNSIDPAHREAWLSQLREMKWDACAGFGGLSDRASARVVSHNSYLINLASPNDELRRKSIDAMRMELERCESLAIPFCVAHPGAHLGTPRSPREPNVLRGEPGKDELAGLRRIVESLDRIHRDLPGHGVITCLETTVGSGTNLGYAFHHLNRIREGVREPQRIGFCFDTCHVSAAGYDMTTDDAAAAVIEEFDAVCGIEHLHVFHINDSLGAVGSRKDRHAHIGEGLCGRACFRTIVNHDRFAGVPKILETPKQKDAKGREWDVVNVQRLKRLKRRPAACR